TKGVSLEDLEKQLIMEERENRVEAKIGEA
ncbi:MAG: hypothetical protein RL013_1433, partial [Bacteroidota bacterium]